MRLIYLISIFTILCLLDAATTIYLHENFASGRELNPYVDPGSWQGILLAPFKFLIYAVFIGSLLLAERNSKTISAKGGLLSDAALLAYFPLFLIFTKVLAVVNNLMPLIGISTPISYILTVMKGLPGDEAWHYSLFWSMMFLMLAPLGLMAVKRLYP